MRSEEELKKEVYNKCVKKECGGTFMKMVPSEGKLKLVPCECFEKLVRNGRYDFANIPEEFWEFTVDDIEQGFDKGILDMFRDFKEVVQVVLKNKSLIYFQGLNGRGKTTIAILMLKEVLNAGFKGRIYKAFELIDLLYHDEIDELYELDFIVIDEIDKLRSEKQIIDLSRILKDVTDKISTLFISNSPIEYLKNNLHFEEYIIDVLNSASLVHFRGENYRQGFIPKFDAIRQSLKDKRENNGS